LDLRDLLKNSPILGTWFIVDISRGVGKLNERSEVGQQVVRGKSGSKLPQSKMVVREIWRLPDGSAGKAFLRPIRDLPCPYECEVKRAGQTPALPLLVGVFSVAHQDYYRLVEGGIARVMQD
jgi:hypothetical protein